MPTLEAFRPHVPALWALALLGLLGLNGAFVYGVLTQPEGLALALTNPVAAAFVLEAFVMTAFGAWALARLGYRRPGPGAFVLLSLLGGLAFSVPLFVVLQLRKREPARAQPAAS